jgi:hypothetical protein
MSVASFLSIMNILLRIGHFYPFESQWTAPLNDRNKKINENKLVGGTTTWGTIWGSCLRAPVVGPAQCGQLLSRPALKSYTGC